jgi:pimeloyl-ACP methyl ester carboxylesterase
MLRYLSYLLIICLFVGCKTTDQASQKNDFATQAASYGFDYRTFQNGPLPIYGWVRLNDPSQPIHVYIEGDGFAYITKSRPSSDPTPTRPIALDLAKIDRYANVVYLGRPCHYASDHDFKTTCHKKYWTTHRFDQTVVNSFQAVLNDLGGDGYHLIGFSGGANIAGLLAASRTDVASIRTIAGNVDNDFFTSFHKVSDMPYSLNMADYADRLSSIPQYHFIAAEDKFVPIDIFKSYQSKLNDQSCVSYEVVSNTTHLDGWVVQWPTLLRRPFPCVNSSRIAHHE